MAGNSNSGRFRDKPFRKALNMELAAMGDDYAALREMARKLIEQGKTGDLNAIKEIADRTDGKPAQAIIGGDEDDPALKHEHTVVLDLG